MRAQFLDRIGSHARAGAILGLLCLLPAYPAIAEAAGDFDSSVLPPTPYSMGQPPLTRVRWGSLGGYNFPREQATTRLFASVARPILGPKLCGLEGTLEAAGGTLGETGLASGGVYIGLPWFAAGAEWSVGVSHRSSAEARGNVTPALSLRFPIHRGGLFGHGDLLRLDYHLARGEWLAGITFHPPWDGGRPWRPARTGVDLPRAPASLYAVRGDDSLGSDVERQLEIAAHSIEWMDRLLTPAFRPDHLQEDAAGYRDHIRMPGHTYLEEDAAYHRALDAAYSLALGDSLAGRRAAALAESVIFREVVVPFDRLLGQEKSVADAGGYGPRALQVFREQLGSTLQPMGSVDSARVDARSSAILRRLIGAVRSASIASGRRWMNQFLLWSNRGSLAWIPLNCGLRPEQYDTQAEWDSVLSTVTGEPYTCANRVEYLMMEQFHPELKRMIRETRDYQVTIVHDFRGRTAAGMADLYGWDLVADGYLKAFTEAVRELDGGKRARLPQFFLFLDQNYYESNKSRALVKYIENLYDSRAPRLKPRECQDQVNAEHDSLLAAIRRSPRLKGATERQLRECFRVHVNITNVFDPSYVLDLTRRDHRKIAFCDVTEEDPASGKGLVTGQGVGEHYNGSGWEDRSLLLRGPSLVQLKSEARNLLLHQGFSEARIPECLRAQPLPADYAERCAKIQSDSMSAAVNVLVNETGYGPKEATVLKAALYNLAPPGSRLLCYDSLWLSEFWAGMFVSASLRGANLLPVGPVPPNAPSASATTLKFLRSTLRTMVQAREYFGDDLRRSGGELRVGLYAHACQTNDMRSRATATLHGIAEYRFLRELFPIDSSVVEYLRMYRDRWKEISPFVQVRMRPRPFLHMKSQLFGTKESFGVLGLPEMTHTLDEYLKIRLDQVRGMNGRGIGVELYRDQIEAFEEKLKALPEAQRNHRIFTLTTGSHNQNPRSMLLDGEDLVAVSGNDCLVALIDFMFVLYATEWPTTEAEFDRLFPPQHVPLYMKLLLKPLKDQS
jgi:hypothetical protein